jgi:hypothetical protein
MLPCQLPHLVKQVLVQDVRMLTGMDVLDPSGYVMEASPPMFSSIWADFSNYTHAVRSKQQRQ